MATQIIEHLYCPKKDKVYGAKGNPMKEEGKYRCARCGEVFQIAKTVSPPVKVEKPDKSLNSVHGKEKQNNRNKFSQQNRER